MAPAADSQGIRSAHLSDEHAAAVAAELGKLQHDLDFLRTTNNVHNMHYAAKLTQALIDRLSALCRELKVAEPKVALPPPMRSNRIKIGRHSPP